MRILILLLLLASLTGFSQIPGTYGEIYDFEIGDEFRWSVGDYNYQTYKGYYGTISTIYKDKYLSPSGDTLYYLRKFHSSITESGKTTITDKIDTVFYTNLDSVIKSPDTSHTLTVYYDSLKFNKRTIYEIEFSGFDILYRHTYIAGCGLEYYDYPYNDYYYYKYLEYFKKGNEEWGDRYAGYIANSPGANEILVYPVPASNVLHIEFPIGNNDKRLVLLDLNGRIIFERQSAGLSLIDIDVARLQAGSYTLRSISEDGIEEKRIVISK